MKDFSGLFCQNPTICTKTQNLYCQMKQNKNFNLLKYREIENKSREDGLKGIPKIFLAIGNDKK